MANSIAIIGAGLVGRLLALKMAKHGWQVHLYDRDDKRGKRSCAFAGAGMLAPYCELENSELIISELGTFSLSLWPKIIASLKQKVFFNKMGSLVVAHPNDHEELAHLKQKICSKLSDFQQLQDVRHSEIAKLESEISRQFHNGLFFPNEGQIDNRALLKSLTVALEEQNIEWTCNQSIDKVDAHKIYTPQKNLTFDYVIDCRGLGAQKNIRQLRGVRGELLIVSAPEVNLKRPIRLVHPRYPLYIVPRENHIFVIGATSIESEDFSPISVRSVLELLSAAYTLHPAFAEARILETVVQCRPALPDNLPKIYHKPGLLRINGLYRHGFLITPALVAFAHLFLEEGKVHPLAETILQKEDFNDNNSKW